MPQSSFPATCTHPASINEKEVRTTTTTTTPLSYQGDKEAAFQEHQGLGPVKHLDMDY
jgi:hypothetical protein